MRQCAIAVLILGILVGTARADWVTKTVDVGTNPRATAANPITNKIYVANFSSSSTSVTVIDGATNGTAPVTVGTGPRAIAVNPITNRIYVANYYSSDVTVINGATNGVIATVAAGTYPRAIAVNSVTNKIYVANYSSTYVTVINGATNETTRVAVGTNPYAVAVNPVTNRTYVANSGNDRVTIINGATNDTASVAVGSDPRAVAVNPVTNKIYVANYGSGKMTVIDGLTKGTTSIVTGYLPLAVAVNCVTNKVYVANSGDHNVTVVDGATNRIDATVGAGTQPYAVAVNPVTNKIYVPDYADNSKRVTVIDGATNGTSTVTTGLNTDAVSVNPVTNKIYAANYGSNTVSVIDGATNGTTPVTVGSNPRAVAVNPVTNKIYVANSGSTSNSVTVIDGSNNNPLNVGVGTTPCAVAVNPVTNRIYVANSGSSNVTVVDGQGDAVLATVAAGTQPCAVAVNVVTNKIYVANYAGSNVTVINGATNSTVTVTVGTGPRAIAVNPATNKIYVANYVTNDVMVINGATNDTTRVAVDTRPCAVAVNPVTNKVYVADSGNAKVTVINGATDVVVKTVTVGNGPRALAVNPVTNRIYVANSVGNTVTVIDGTTDAAFPSVAAGTSPYAVTVNRVANKIYVANRGSANVTVIDGATNSPATVTANTNPCAVAVNPVTNKTYVANWGTSDVTVITHAPNNDTKVHAAFDPSPGTWTPLARPALTGTGSNSSTPNGNVMMGVVNHTNTAQAAWDTAAVTSGAGTVSITWTYNWGTDSLIPGENFICVQPLESDAAITNNEGLGTPFAGNLLVFPIYRIPPDVGADSVLRPVASFLMPSWKIPPLVRIKNFGSVTQGPFGVRLTISPGDYTPSTRTVQSLAAGDTCTVEFDSLTLATGVFTARCSTMLAGDLTSGNDARTAYFQGCTFVDYADYADSGLTSDPETCWTRDVPSNSPWTVPPFMDDKAWGERLNGVQNNNENSYLTSPEYTAAQNYPSIAFQHCFSTESLMDGGNVQYKFGTGGWNAATPSAGFPYDGNVLALGGPGWSGWQLSQSGWKQSVFTFDDVTNGVSFWVRWHYASGTSVPSHGWLVDEIAGIGCYWHAPVYMSGHGSVIDTVNVWPNMVRGAAQVHYTLKKDCNVTISLYDASGRLAARVPTSGFKKGPNTARLDASGLARGVYFVKVRGETDTRTTKVIVE